LTIFPEDSPYPWHRAEVDAIGRDPGVEREESRWVRQCIHLDLRRFR
jgi:hypothetical protein